MASTVVDLRGALTNLLLPPLIAISAQALRTSGGSRPMW